MIVGILFIILGGINVIKPSIFVEYQRFVSKKILGAEFKPSEKTYKVRQIIGVFFIVVGFLILAR